jgi:hypothetical protein
MNTSTRNSQPSPASAPWDGQPLYGEPIAVLLTIAPQTADGPPPAFVAGTRASNSCVVLVNQVGTFLDRHREKLLVCMNAAQFHWAMSQILSQVEDRQGRRALWRLSTRAKFADVRLLQKLVTMATAESAPDPTLDGDSAACPVADVSQILDQFDRLYVRATELSDIAGIDAVTVNRHGPLGVGLQVKGAIALCRASQRPLRINAKRRVEVEPEMEQLQADFARRVARDDTLRRCFQPATGGIVFSDDLPRLNNERLREWLRDNLAECENVEGGPLPCPQESNGKLSLAPEAWGILRQCDPQIGTWAQLAEVSNSLRFLREKESIRVEYDAFPRIWQRPDAKLIGSLVGKSLIEPSPGKQFVVGEFVDLEFRAFAFYCRRCYDAQSRLAQLVEQAPDAIQAIANYLADHQEFSRFFASGDIVRGDCQLDATRALLTALIYKLSYRHTFFMLREEVGLSITSSDTERLQHIVIELFPELRAHLDADSALRLLSSNLEIDESACQQALGAHDARTIQRAIHGLRVGRGFEQIFNQLHDLNRNSRLREALGSMSGSRGLAECLFSRPVSTPTGRVRGPALFSEGVAEHLDIVDDVIKAVAYSLVAGGADLVALNDRTWVVEVPNDGVADECRRLERLAKAAALQMLDGIVVPCECEAKCFW